jgi:hypothetical protein
MEVGAPYSEPGSRRERQVSQVIGSRREVKRSNLQSAGYAVNALDVGASVPAVWLSDGARESRGARPGLT